MQPSQVWLARLQTSPVAQLVVVWQLPVMQTPPLQRYPVPYSLVQSVSIVHAPQNIVPVLQMVPPAAQSPFTRQLPETQAPEPLQMWSAT